MLFNELDIVFLSYNEPQKEQFWAELKSLVPWAKRVDGVIGFLSAFQKCAEVAQTEHFFMIDGDTHLSKNFDPNMELPALNSDSVFTWASRNAINGLVYGNGSIKLWPRSRLLDMISTEGFRRLSGYFADDIQYLRQPEIFSETSPNGSEEQAFIYGFREVLRFCVEWLLHQKPKKCKPEKFVGGKYKMLQTICGVGSDVINGIWANIGGLEAIRFTLAGGLYSIVGDYERLTAAYLEAKKNYKRNPEQQCRSAIKKINNEEDLELFWLASTESKAFKENR